MRSANGIAATSITAYVNGTTNPGVITSPGRYWRKCSYLWPGIHARRTDNIWSGRIRRRRSNTLPGIFMMAPVTLGVTDGQVLNHVDDSCRSSTCPRRLIEVGRRRGGHALHEPPEDVPLGFGSRAAWAGEGELPRPSRRKSPTAPAPYQPMRSADVMGLVHSIANGPSTNGDSHPASPCCRIGQSAADHTHTHTKRPSPSLRMM